MFCRNNNDTRIFLHNNFIKYKDFFKNIFNVHNLLVFLLIRTITSIIIKLWKIIFFLEIFSLYICVIKPPVKNVYRFTKGFNA